MAQIVAGNAGPRVPTHWEQNCDTALKQVEFEVTRNWPGCYIHRHLSGFLVVYVDDFKLVAPKKISGVVENLLAKN